MGISLGLEAIFFNKLDLHNDFIGVTWQYLANDIVGASFGTAVGGGMIGALLYTGTDFLLAQLGSYLISLLLIGAGLCMLFGISLQQVAQFFGKIGLVCWNGIKLIAGKLKNAAGTAKDSLQDAAEKRKAMVPEKSDDQPEEKEEPAEPEDLKE